MEFPFWLAQKLKNDDKRIVSVTLPKPYRETYRDMYRADAQVVDLQALGPNFYNLAMKMPLIDSIQAKDISTSALQVGPWSIHLYLILWCFYLFVSFTVSFFRF